MTDKETPNKVRSYCYLALLVHIYKNFSAQSEIDNSIGKSFKFQSGVDFIKKFENMNLLLL